MLDAKTLRPLSCFISQQSHGDQIYLQQYATAVFRHSVVRAALFVLVQVSISLYLAAY